MPQTTSQDDRDGRDRPTRQDDERLRLFVESVVDYAMFMLDPTGVVQTWNRGAQRLKGWTEEEIVGQHFSVFYRDEDREAGLPWKLLAQAREHGHTEHRGWRVRKDGTRFFGDIVITAVFDEDGELTGFGKVTRDLTEQHLYEQAREGALEERQRAADRLEELDEWRREFLSAITHDLRNPIVAIRGFAEMLVAEPDADPEERKDLLDRILHSAATLAGMVEHLRTFSRLEDGRVELNREPLHLATVVNDLLRTLEPVLDGHEVVSDVPDSITVEADRQGLDRILSNLLTNAARHTGRGTSIRVAADEADAGVTVVVSDDGPGIPADLRDRIFDRYVGGQRGGGGLGLAIVRRYVDLHDGEIAVDSGRDGTTFRIRFPHLSE